MNMLMRKKSRENIRCAQSVMEYTLIIAISVGALVSMHQYLSRSLQGRLRNGVESLSGKLTPGGSYSGEVGGTLNGHSRITTSMTEFSYEGGQYEGSVITRGSNRNEYTQLHAQGSVVTTGNQEEDNTDDNQE
jgi:hypothetical protein